MSKEKNDVYRKAFVDISRGYSESIYRNVKIFIKHFNIYDQGRIDESAQKISKRYQKSGLKTEKEILDEAKRSGDWTDKHEAELEQRRNFLKTLTNTKKSLIIPSQVQQIENKIKDVEKEIQQKGLTKQLLLKDSCEAFTERKISDLTIAESIFQDSDLKNRFFSQEEFDDLEREEIYELVKIYNDSFSELSIETIKELSLSGIFSNYFSVCEKSPCDMFDRKPMDLSFFQLNLLNYGQVFKSIFKNVPNIPDEIKNNPDKLLDFAESGNEKAQKIKEMQNKGNPNRTGAQSIVGASKEDMSAMGFNEGNFTSPAELLKKAGKSSLSTLKGDF